MTVKRLPLWAKIVTGVALSLIVAIAIAVGLAPTIVRHVIEGDGGAKLHRRIIIHGAVGVDACGCRPPAIRSRP